MVQVVPGRSAEPNGVADYAQCLASTLRTCLGIDTVFLSGVPWAHPSGMAHPPGMKDEWKTVCVPSRRPQSLADTLGLVSTESHPVAVILHFSGYGYQKRGVPFWLLHGLRVWQKSKTHVPLLTIFHELYATGKIWQSSFWLSYLQKRIARSIVDLSLGAITPTSLNRSWLQECGRGHAEIICMPVFSNIGEPGSAPAPCARAGTAVVFGLAGVEERLYGEYGQAIERALITLGVKKVLDIGPRVGSLPSSLAGVPIVSTGALPRESVSNLLTQARFGFVAYPLNAIGKSGVFAAYAAHGVVPIVFSERRELFDGLEPGRHFIDGLRLAYSVEADALALMQSELSNWYRAHSLQVQAEQLEKLILSTARHSDRTVHH